MQAQVLHSDWRIHHPAKAGSPLRLSDSTNNNHLYRCLDAINAVWYLVEMVLDGMGIILMIKTPTVRVDLRGFVHVDGVPVCRYNSKDEALEFVDKDRRRSALRGGRIVQVKLDELVKLRENKGS